MTSHFSSFYGPIFTVSFDKSYVGGRNGYLCEVVSLWHEEIKVFIPLLALGAFEWCLITVDGEMLL
jgi:hypothetical protein